jgi:hypothetical protein
MSALKNLATGADGGATRAQALYNSKFGIGVAALDAGNEVLQGDMKGDPAPPPTPPPPTPPSNQPDPSEMMRQQERMAAEANAFAANSAALRHNDYYNPF